MVAALPAGRRAGQLRLAGQRPAGRDALHRGAADPAGDGDAARNRRGDSRFHPELRRPGRRSRRSCRAGSPTCWPTAPAASRSAWPPTSRRTTCASWPRPSTGAWRTTRPTRRRRSPRCMRAGQGTRLPHRRPDRRDARASRTPTAPAAARSRMRGVVEIEEDAAAAPASSSPNCRIRSTTTTSSPRSPSRCATARWPASPNIEDQSSDRVGLRIVVEIKRDAVAKVVLNNLYKHTQLQTSFGCNMLVDRRRRPAHAAPGPDDPPLRRPPARRHRPAHHATGCARPTSGPTSCAVWSRRSTRSTR